MPPPTHSQIDGLVIIIIIIITYTKVIYFKQYLNKIQLFCFIENKIQERMPVKLREHGSLSPSL